MITIVLIIIKKKNNIDNDDSILQIFILNINLQINSLKIFQISFGLKSKFSIYYAQSFFEIFITIYYTFFAININKYI
jgi:hypothetical protein